MAYDLTKLTRLQALQELARRTKTEMDKNHNSILDAMYQAPTATEYRTKGNLTNSGAGSILDETLGSLLDLSGLTADGEGKYAFTLNGQLVGSYTAETKLSEVLHGINSSDAGVEAGYSQTSGEFLFRARQTGSAGEVLMGEGLAQAMFEPDELNSSIASFTDAYGINWLDEGESTEISFNLPGWGTKFEVSTGDTIKDIADRLNTTSQGVGYTAFYNKYTGQLEVKDQDGAAVELRVCKGDDNDWELTFKNKYAPTAVTYTPGQDGIFTAIKVNGKVQKVSGKAVDISEYIGAANLEFAADAEVDEMLNEVFATMA